ncbi:MAG: aspartate aminotransferase family protein [Candidatus Verstraetearchaeota archaeon]|nr:aspartate aminotransferase family protein [Candidatus Verstraetearchaeota archaeon]
MSTVDPEERYKQLHPGSYLTWQEASKYLPGGVSAYGQFRKPFPLYFKKAKGARLWDVDNREYIDVHCGYGPILLGHGHPTIINAIEEAKERGLQYGAPSDVMVEWAKLILKHVPSIKKIRFVSTGSEAVTYAVRVCKGYTRRTKICKPEGSYHGTSDWSLASTAEYGGPPEAPTPVPHSMGLDHAIDKFVIIPWNDPDNAVKIIKQNAKDLACVLMEPISGTGLGFVEPTKEYLKALREVTAENDIPLIFDEVMVGFRWGNMSCAQGYLGVKPDLTILGKVIAGGAPVGAYGGREDIMEVVSPLHGKTPQERVYQSGTFCGNPFTASVGLAILKYLDAHENEVYSHVNSIAESIRNGVRDLVTDMKIQAQVVGKFSNFEVHFTDKPYRNLREFLKVNKDKLRKVDIELINRGIFKLPGHFAFTCLPHTQEDVAKILDAYQAALKIVG